MIATIFFFCVPAVHAADGKTAWQAEWEKTLEAAKKEGRVVVAIPPSPELRKELESTFKQRFGIDMELVPGPGPQHASRIASEHKAGVRYFDAFIVGTGTALPLAQEGIVEPLEPSMILPDVKDPKNWWAGHVWDDNVSTMRFLYSFIADVGTGGLWYNPNLLRPEEVRSIDDFLNPKLRQKIGFSDPRVPGAAYLVWYFLWELRGEDFLRKLVEQDVLWSRNPRQIADALAKGQLALSIGVGYSQYEPFLKSGLPVKPLPALKEGSPVTTGFGILGLVKNPRHANAAKVFANWLLGKEGQELYGKVMQHATRRLDVDTKWMTQFGSQAAKDVMTVEDFHRLRTHLEDRVTSQGRLLSKKLADEILK